MVLVCYGHHSIDGEQSMNKPIQKIVLSILIVLLSACAHRPGYHSTYSGDSDYYGNGYYGNNNPYPGYGNYQGYGGGYGRPYPGGYNSNNYYNNYYDKDDDNHHDHGNHSGKPWQHGGFRDDKRYYRQQANDGQQGYGWKGGHDDDNHSSNWGGWHKDNDGFKPRPPTEAGQSRNPGNFNWQGENPHGRPTRESSMWAGGGQGQQRPAMSRPSPIVNQTRQEPPNHGGNMNFGGDNPHGRPVRQQSTPPPRPSIEQVVNTPPMAVGGGHGRPERVQVMQDLGRNPRDRRNDVRGGR